MLTAVFNEFSRSMQPNCRAWQRCCDALHCSYLLLQRRAQIGEHPWVLHTSQVQQTKGRSDLSVLWGLVCCACSARARTSKAHQPYVPLADNSLAFSPSSFRKASISMRIVATTTCRTLKLFRNSTRGKLEIVRTSYRSLASILKPLKSRPPPTQSCLVS